MARENTGWGAPRIHGELLKLGFEISEQTVSRLMPRSTRPPSQSWRTFLTNHVGELTSIDFFVVPTVTFRLVYVLVILRHARRRVVHVNVTESPTAEWTAQQAVEGGGGLRPAGALWDVCGVERWISAEPTADAERSKESAWGDSGSVGGVSGAYGRG